MLGNVFLNAADEDWDSEDDDETSDSVLETQLSPVIHALSSNDTNS